MTIRKILTEPNKTLRVKSLKVDKVDKVDKKSTSSSRHFGGVWPREPFN